jgi:hypothetical protein
MPAGRILIAAGIVLVMIGALVTWGPRLPFRLGRLPGDIHWEGKNGSSFSFPIVTCLLLSVLLSAVMWLLRRMR